MVFMFVPPDVKLLETTAWISCGSNSLIHNSSERGVYVKIIVIYNLRCFDACPSKNLRTIYVQTKAPLSFGTRGGARKTRMDQSPSLPLISSTARRASSALTVSVALLC